MELAFFLRGVVAAEAVIVAGEAVVSGGVGGIELGSLFEFVGGLFELAEAVEHVAHFEMRGRIRGVDGEGFLEQGAGGFGVDGLGVETLGMQKIAEGAGGMGGFVLGEAGGSFGAVGG